MERLIGVSIFRVILSQNPFRFGYAVCLLIQATMIHKENREVI
jgi:hypothetical protein